MSFLRNGGIGGQECGDFGSFFEGWMGEQSQYLEELVSALREYGGQERGKNGWPERQADRILRPVIGRVIRHYEHYYRAKSRWAKMDVISMLNPAWRSSLEDAFLWIGGWRPSTAFHLLYSKLGLQLEARLDEVMRGLSADDLSGLSPSQLEQVDALQKGTIDEEKKISEKLAKQQAALADSSMVELSHAASQNIRDIGGGSDDSRLEAALALKEGALIEILQRADGLRMKTLTGVLNVLTPVQGVQFLIAAAELHQRLHEWGKRRDDKKRKKQSGGCSGQKHRDNKK